MCIQIISAEQTVGTQSVRHEEVTEFYSGGDCGVLILFEEDVTRLYLAQSTLHVQHLVCTYLLYAAKF